MQTCVPGIIVLFLNTVAAVAITSGIPLPQLAASRFGTLSRAEGTLVNAAANGEKADCSELSGADRVIRGDLLSWLCTNSDASAQLTYRGISIVGAEIVNKIDLEWARVSLPIRAVKCVLRDAIILDHSYVASLDLAGSSIQELWAVATHFDGDLYLRNGFKAEGVVYLVGANINGYLDCDGGEFIGKREPWALNAGRAVVKGGVFLRDGFKAAGGVNLVSATIEEGLDCDGGRFASVRGPLPTLNVNGAEVKGNVFLGSAFKADGEVNLVAAKIDGQLVCDGGLFISGAETPALNANGFEVKGNVYLRNGFKADGEVDLVAAKIGGYLWCDGGEFVSKGGTPALDASSANIEGSAYFRGEFRANGEVVFWAASVGRDFQWSDVKLPEKSVLDLRFCKAGTLFNPRNSWPTRGNLRIDGFVYDQFDGRALPQANVQLGWLRLQPEGRFLSQPYEQLAGVLRKMGFEEEAKKVRIAKNQDQARHFDTMKDWLWLRVFGPLIGYGYRPMRALWIGLCVIALGCLFFWTGYISGIITPTEEKAYVDQKYGKLSELYPKYNPFIYSLETFVPLLQLGISKSWVPNANRRGSLRLGRLVVPMSGSLLRVYLWFHIIVGWILSVLWVGAVTGLVKT